MYLFINKYIWDNILISYMLNISLNLSVIFGVSQFLNSFPYLQKGLHNELGLSSECTSQNSNSRIPLYLDGCRHVTTGIRWFWHKIWHKLGASGVKSDRNKGVLRENLTETRGFWGKIWQKWRGSEVTSNRNLGFWGEMWQKIGASEVKSDRN